MILQSNDRFDELVEFDRDSGSYELLSSEENPKLSGVRIAGSYSRFGQTMVSLYRANGNLFLRIGDQEFEITADVYSTIEEDAGQRIFRLFHKEALSIAFKYSTPVTEVPTQSDPTPFVEEEHFDFLLFVHHVLVQPDRRDRVYHS